MLLAIFYIYICCAVVYTILRIVKLVPALLFICSTLCLAPFIPFVFFRAAWHSSQRYYALFAMLAYLSFIGLLIYGSSL